MRGNAKGEVHLDESKFTGCLLIMIQAMQGWLAFPFRLSIALGLAWAISHSFNSEQSKLDFGFLASKAPAVQTEATARSSEASAASWLSLPKTIGLSAIAALVLYVWVAYEWVGYSKFEKACTQLRRLGGRVSFPSGGDKPFLQYYFRSEAVVDLSHRRLSAEHFQLLTRLPKIQRLCLDQASVPPNFVKMLKGVRSLKKIAIDGVQLTEADRRELAKILSA